MRPKFDELRPALEVCPSRTFEKHKWLGLLLLQSMGIYALHHNSRIPFESAKRVFDDEAMMIYPWDQSAYEVLVNSIKMLSPQGWSYTINGLKDMLQVWAYESVSCLRERFGRVVNEEEILLFRWGGKLTRASFATVRVRKIVMNESLHEHFPQWPDEADDPRLVKLIINIHAGRFVGSFWDLQRNENKKTTKDEVTIAALKSIMITLDNISRKVDNYDDKFEMVDSRLTVYNSNIVDLAREISNIDKNICDRVEAAVYERLKYLGVGENNVNPIPYLPAPHDFSQKSVNSPPPTVYKTPAKKSVNSLPPTTHKTHAKGSGVKMSLGEQVAKANAKGLGAKDFGNTEVDFVYVSPAKDQPFRRGCRGKPKQKEDEEVAAKKKEAAELKKKQAELKKQAAELKKKKVAELKKQKDEVQKDAPVIRRTRAGVIRIHITQKKYIEDDSELMDVTDDHVALQNELLSESDMEEEDRIRSARIKFYRERGAQLSPNVLAVMSAVAPLARIFPYIGDNRTMRVRKDIEPSATIYDPIAPADSVKIDKLIQHLQSFEKISLKHAHEDVEFYRIRITKRPWPNLEYEWLYQNSMWLSYIFYVAGPFWSKRIAFIDSWFLGVWIHDYQHFKLKPRQFKISLDVKTNLKWLQDVDHLYKVINIRGGHWVRFDVDLLKEKIDCYDPIIEHVTEESEQKVLAAFRPLTQMIQVMMSEVIHASI
ncbi:hypothetical protein N665_0215s0014 [Sinapis alba]|nr:hypothetical protein N665_0215s0014 [Sinapis alba]